MPAWRAYYNRRSPLRRPLFQGSAQRTSFFYFSFFLLHKQQRGIQQCHNHRNRKQGNFQPQTVRVFSHDFFRGCQINLRKYRNRELHSKEHLLIEKALERGINQKNGRCGRDHGKKDSPACLLTLDLIRLVKNSRKNRSARHSRGDAR